MKRSHACCIAFLCCIAVAFSFSISLANTSSSAGNDTFQLIILKQDWYDLKLGSAYSQALPALQSANKDDRVFIIGMNEIEEYNWTRQSITLTHQATTHLIKSLPREEDLKKHVQAMGRVKRERGWGNVIETALHLKGFLVSIDSTVAYGGIFLEPMSELAINYPVIRVAITAGKAVLYILPVQIPFVAYDPPLNDDAAWTAAIAPEGAQPWAHFPPPMRSRFMSMGTGPKATESRNLIRNSRIRTIMIKAGKLHE